MQQTLRRNVRQALASEVQAVDEALDRAETVLALPWRTREPQRFEPDHLKQALDRTHGGLEPVKKRLIEVLAACPQTRGLLTVEGPRRGRGADTDACALAVRPGPPEAPGSVLCLAGQPGTGKRSLAIAVARALGRTEQELPGTREAAAASDTPAVVVERELLSVQELERWSAGAPPPDVGETWRTAACTGGVRLETEAILRVIRDHTREAGVAELNRKLAAICSHVVSRRPPGGRGPEVITEATVREVLGDGAGNALPPAVRAAVESERRRLSANADPKAAPSNDWIEWLEHLPWNRRSDTPSDLAQARAALDARHAGLDHAKARIVEYLAVRRRNPRGPGAVLCFSGPPGVARLRWPSASPRPSGAGS